MPLLKSFLVLLMLMATCCHAFVQSSFGRRNNDKWTTRFESSALKALTPIGPFCPFRSSATLEVEPKMEQLNERAPEFAADMAKVQLDLQMGNEPDEDALFRVADGIEQAVNQWETLLARLKLSGDFQTREYAKLTEAHLATHGMTPQGIASMMRWQGGCMRAMALSAPPPMPPSDLDLQRLMQNSAADKPTPSVASMAGAESITANPFDEGSLETESIRLEYEQLCRDHNGLIEMGVGYSNFDPSGKLAFLDQVEEIEDRWDVFFTRFSLMGELNADFISQCNAFLESMSLDETEYRKLLKKSHALLRADAEEERDTFSY